MKNTKVVEVYPKELNDPLYKRWPDWWNGSWLPAIPESACWVEYDLKRLENEGWVYRYPC